MPEQKSTDHLRVPRCVSDRAPNSSEKVEIAPIGVTVEEAADLLSTSVYSIRILCRRGALKHKVVGTRWIVSRKSIDEFFDSPGTSVSIRKRAGAA